MFTKEQLGAQAEKEEAIDRRLAALEAASAVFSGKAGFSTDILNMAKRFEQYLKTGE